MLGNADESHTLLEEHGERFMAMILQVVMGLFIVRITTKYHLRKFFAYIPMVMRVVSCSPKMGEVQYRCYQKKQNSIKQNLSSINSVRLNLTEERPLAKQCALSALPPCAGESHRNRLPTSTQKAVQGRHTNKTVCAYLLWRCSSHLSTATDRTVIHAGWTHTLLR